MIVDDEPGILYALSKMLEFWGWTVIGADSYASAIAMLPGPFDLVILDMWLPDGYGSDILRKIRDDGLTCRVAISTGHGQSDALDAALAMKPDGVFPKPVDRELFGAFVLACHDEAIARCQKVNPC